MNNQLLSAISLVALSTLTACDWPSITINVNEPVPEDATADVTAVSPAPAPAAPQTAIAVTPSAVTAAPAPAPLLKAQPLSSAPPATPIAQNSAPIHTESTDCEGSYILETMESLDFAITICYSPEDLVPSYYIGTDKDTGDAIVLPLTDYDNSDWTNQYIAQNGEYSYAIASDSQKWPNGALIVRQGSKELLRQPFSDRTLILEGGQVNW